MFPHLACALLVSISVEAAGGSHSQPPWWERTGYSSSAQETIPVNTERRIDLQGYIQFWWTLLEQTENGLKQPLTGDEAATETSGFSINRARIAGDFNHGGLKGRLSVSLESSPVALLEAYVGVPLIDENVVLWAGQMKIPATYEVATPSNRLDFLTRSQLSKTIADYALSRSPSISHPRLYGVRTKMRDLGIALRGQVSDASYFVMVGNGLGVNRFVGGRERKQEVFTNPPGAHFYGARVEYASRFDPLKPFVSSVNAGAHATWNHHPDIVLDDERTVLDIDRRSYSADLRIGIVERFTVTGMIAAGEVDDDFDNDGKIDYQYRGWEAKAVAAIAPGIINLGLRCDRYEDEYHESGVVDCRTIYTFGGTWTPRPDIKVQLSYRYKTLDSPIDLDLDDNILLLGGQVNL